MVTLLLLGLWLAAAPVCEAAVEVMWICDRPESPFETATLQEEAVKALIAVVVGDGTIPPPAGSTSIRFLPVFISAATILLKSPRPLSATAPPLDRWTLFTDERHIRSHRLPH